MADKVQIDIVTTAQTTGATQATEALKGTSKEAQTLSQNANVAATDVARLDMALDKLRARRRQMVTDGVQGDLEGFTRRGNVLNNTIDRLQGRRDAAVKADPAAGDLSSSMGAGFNAPAQGVADQSGKLTSNLTQLSMLLSQAAFAVGAGIQIGDEIQKNWFNWASTMAAGGWSTDADQTKAQQALSEQGKAISDFYEKAKQLNSVDDKYALLESAQALQSALIKQKSGLAINETSQKAAIDASVAQLQAFWEQLFKLDPAGMTDAQQRSQAAQKQAAEEAADAVSKQRYNDQLTAEQNRASFAALSRDEQIQSLKARIDTQNKIANSPVGGNFSNEDRAAARTNEVQLRRELAQIEARITAEKERQAEKDKEQAARAEEITERLRGQLQIETFRAQGKEQAANQLQATLAVEAEIESLRKSGVTDEKLLSDYATAKRASLDLALERKREELDLETQLNEAKATGNKEEEEKLKWLQQYNQLRSQGFSDEEARRSANASLAAQNPATAAYVKPGEVVPGTNSRRGRTESDSSFAMSEADRKGGSLLDAYNATRNLPVGSQGGKDPTKATASNGAQDVNSAADNINKQAAALNEAASALANAGNSLSGEGITALKKAVDSLTAKVEALSKKI